MPDKRRWWKRNKIAEGHLQRNETERFACYMACSEHKWIKAAWRRENTKKENSIIEEARKAVEEVEVEIQFEKGNIWIDGELIEEE